MPLNYFCAAYASPSFAVLQHSLQLLRRSLKSIRFLCSSYIPGQISRLGPELRGGGGEAEVGPGERDVGAEGGGEADRGLLSVGERRSQEEPGGRQRVDPRGEREEDEGGGGAQGKPSRIINGCENITDWLKSMPQVW